MFSTPQEVEEILTETTLTSIPDHHDGSWKITSKARSVWAEVFLDEDGGLSYHAELAGEVHEGFIDDTADLLGLLVRLEEAEVHHAYR